VFVISSRAAGNRYTVQVLRSLYLVKGTKIPILTGGGVVAGGGCHQKGLPLEGSRAGGAMSEGSHAERAAAGGEPRRRGPPQEVSAPEGTAAEGERAGRGRRRR
jgi:hypothetical protein